MKAVSLRLNKLKVGVPYVLLVIVMCGRSCSHLLRTQSYTKTPAKREAPSPGDPPTKVWIQKDISQETGHQRKRSMFNIQG